MSTLVSLMPTSPVAPAKSPDRAPTAASSAEQDWWIDVVEDAEAAAAHVQAWDLLARGAMEPNVFREPWMFLPAWKTFRGEHPIKLLFVYRRDPRPKQPPQLCGFFPLEERTRFKGLPIRTLRLWEHCYGFLGTPLVHRDWGAPTLHRLFDWIAASRRYSLIEFPAIHGDGPFHQTLLDVRNERGILSFVSEAHTRALLQRAENADAYCASSMNHLSRKEWRRQRRRLEEQGYLETRVLESKGDASAWIEQFLQLEASGWKGKENTAMSMSETDRAYFRSIASAGWERGRFQMMGLFFNGRPIAMKCNFSSGPGAFAFKIAFDENFAKYSPGVQLELDNIEEVHRQPTTQWMDSCAAPGHFMINRLWKDRRTIESLVLATSRWTGQAIVGALPMLRAASRMFYPKKV